MDIQQFITENGPLKDSAGWIIQVFIVVFVALLFDCIQKRIPGHLLRKLEKTTNSWDDALHRQVRIAFPTSTIHVPEEIMVESSSASS